MDTHVLGTLHQLHRRLSELTGMIRALHDEVKEIRQTGVAINFELVEEEDMEEETSESGEESAASGDSATTWP